MEKDFLATALADGLSAAEIARRTGRHASTVGYWLRKHGLRPVEMGKPKRIERECFRHGRCEWVLENRGAYRCVRCRSEAVSRRRRTVKRILVSEAGDRCVLCGYDEYVGALQFHHLEPRGKAFALSGRGVARALAKARAELAKCVLLCANCHAEVEGGHRSLPAKVTGSGGDARSVPG